MPRNLFVWMLTLSALRASASGQIDRAHRIDDLELVARKGPLVIYTPFASYGGAVYFGASDLASAEQLWKSDGTAEGTRKLRDFNLRGYPPPEGFAAVGSRLFFFVDGGLWQIDSSGRVALVTHLPIPARPDAVAAAGSQLFFAIEDGVHGVELWKSDGTSEGTSLVSDIEPGAEGSGPAMLTPLGDSLFFFATDSVGGYSLWRTDGTASGTQRVKDLPGPGVGDGLVTTLGELLVFIAGDSGNVQAFRLWRSDGTPEGTFPLADFVGDSGSVCPGYCFPYGPSDLTRLGNLALFIANDGVHGRELWKTDGTRDGTALVKDIFPGAEKGIYSGLLHAGGLVFFNAEDPEHGAQLWRSDGSDAGTGLVKNVAPGRPTSSPAFPIAAVGNRALFIVGGFDELFATDGTAAGTGSIHDFGPSQLGSPYLTGFAQLGDADLLFVRWDGTALGLWRTDGTQSGTTPVPVEALQTPRDEIVRVEPRPPATRVAPPRR